MCKMCRNHTSMCGDRLNVFPLTNIRLTHPSCSANRLFITLFLSAKQLQAHHCLLWFPQGLLQGPFLSQQGIKIWQQWKMNHSFVRAQTHINTHTHTKWVTPVLLKWELYCIICWSVAFYEIHKSKNYTFDMILICTIYMYWNSNSDYFFFDM